MSTRKKESNTSEGTTQPERPRRFNRRNSLHTLHCRSGSLNKLVTLSEELSIPDECPNPSPPCHTPKKANYNLEDLQLLNDLNLEKDLTTKRCSASMKIKACCKDKNSLSEQYQKLKRQYQKRGEQLIALEEQCRKMRNLAHDQNSKRKHLEEEMRLNKIEVKRLEKRVEKYKNQREQLQQERDKLVKHIKQLEEATFNQQVLTLQSYKEKIFEEQISKIKQTLSKSRSQRQNELLSQVDKLADQKYNLESLHARQAVANNVLLKQLQDSQQCYQELQQSINKAVTSSVEYIELRERYRNALMEMRDLRKEIIELEQQRQEKQLGRKNSDSNVVLEMSSSMLLELQQ